MKTLILTSSGFLFPKVRQEILKLLPKYRPLNILYIPTASKIVKDDTYAKRDVKILKELDFNIHEVDLATTTKAELQIHLENKDAVYVQGGNGFYLLKHARESGFMDLIKPLVEEGKIIYIGKSAGSYLACPTIEMHTWHSDKWNRFDVADFSALNLVPFLIQAHYSDEFKESIDKGMKQSKYPIKLLTNDQFIFVQGNNAQIVTAG